MFHPGIFSKDLMRSKPTNISSDFLFQSKREEEINYKWIGPNDQQQLSYYKNQAWFAELQLIYTSVKYT